MFTKKTKSRFLILFVFFLSFGSSQIIAQEAIQYLLNLDNIRHHELGVTILFPSISQQALAVRMPTASPGRYAEHNFAKNVFDVHAYDSNGKELFVVKTDIDEWEVQGHDGFVKFVYTLFGNRAGGTYTGIDNRKVHMNMPATFAYGKKMEKRPIELIFDLSKHTDWSVATQLKQISKEKFWAKNYYYFYDSPTIAGEIDFREWKTNSNGKDYTIEVAMLHEGTDKELDDYVNWIKQVVEEEKAIYGSLPDYDYGKYTFLCAYNPWVKGDGMEHRNSTICTSTGNLKDNASRLIGTVAHEFFHCWNVERIRPKSLEPFNFEAANMSGELWFAEGFTSYYDDLALCRTGIKSQEDYITSLARTINYVSNSPGRRYRNPIEMSQHAPFVDAATFIDPTNFDNTFISYYSYGAFLGLALDLSLRSNYKNITLDDLMKYMWEHYGKTEIPYQIIDIENALASVTKDKAFAKNFFDNYIYKSEIPDMESLLAKFGVELKLENEGKTQASNLVFDPSDEGAILGSNISKSQAIYATGIEQGNLLLEINGQKVKDLKSISAQFVIGKTYTLKYIQNGKEETGSFTAQQDASMVTSLLKKAKRKIRKRREKWLKSKQ